MMNPRMNRLRADYQKLRELESRSQFVRIDKTEGNPPDKYVLDLSCKGITAIDSHGQPSISESHQLGIYLPGEYPRSRPIFEMLTHVVHPNIGANGSVCIGDEGDHGWAPSMGLDDVVIRIIQMLRYENYNVESPLNGLAAQWANSHRRLFPLDVSQIISEELIEINLLADIQLIPPDGNGEDLDIRIL